MRPTTLLDAFGVACIATGVGLVWWPGTLFVVGVAVLLASWRRA